MKNKNIFFILGGAAVVAIVAGAMYFSSGKLFKGDAAEALSATSGALYEKFDPDPKILKIDSAKATVEGTVDISLTAKSDVKVRYKISSNDLTVLQPDREFKTGGKIGDSWNGKAPDGTLLKQGKYIFEMTLESGSAPITTETVKKIVEIVDTNNIPQTIVSGILYKDFDITPGKLTLDSTEPINIALSAKYPGSITVEVTGNKGKFELFKSAPLKPLATDDKLDLKWDGKNKESVPKFVEAGEYNILITLYGEAVIDGADVIETVKKHVTVAAKTPDFFDDITVEPATFSASTDGASTTKITSKLNVDAAVTMEILNKKGDVVITLLQNQSYKAGAIVASLWNGTNGGGYLADSDDYRVRLTAVKEGTKKDKIKDIKFTNPLDIGPKSGAGVLYRDVVSLSPVTLKQGESATAGLDFVVNNKDSIVIVAVGNSALETIKTLRDTAVTTKDDEKIELKWDGTGKDGKNVTPGFYVIAVKITHPTPSATIFEEFSRQVKVAAATAPSPTPAPALISDLKVAPSTLAVDVDLTKTTDITFVLAADATVTVEIIDKEKAVVKKLNNNKPPAKAGPVQFAWNGSSENEAGVVQDGNYTVRVTAVSTDAGKKEIKEIKEITGLEVQDTKAAREAIEVKRANEKAAQEQKARDDAESAAKIAASKAKADKAAIETEAIKYKTYAEIEKVNAETARAKAEESAAKAKEALIRATKYTSSGTDKDRIIVINNPVPVIPSTSGTASSGGSAATSTAAAADTAPIVTLEVNPSKNIGPSNKAKITFTTNKKVDNLSVDIVNGQGDPVYNLSDDKSYVAGSKVEIAFDGTNLSAGRYGVKVTAGNFTVLKNIYLDGWTKQPVANESKPAATGVACKAFVDVKAGNRYYEDAEWTRVNRIFEGSGGCLFKGWDYINRAEIVTILVRYFNLQQEAGRSESRFPDVNSSQWFHNNVALAEKQSIVRGYPDRTFKPGNPVTYAEFFRVLFNAAGYSKEVAKVTQIQPNIFPNVEDRTQWFMADLQYAYNKGLIGKEDNFNPGAAISRFEVAKYMHRFGTLKN